MFCFIVITLFSVVGGFEFSGWFLLLLRELGLFVFYLCSVLCLRVGIFVLDSCC